MILKNSMVLSVLTLVFAVGVSFGSHASHHEMEGNELAETTEEAIEKEFNAAEHALHHALDSYEFHFTDDIVIPLPVILWTDNGLVTFMSSEFHHDNDGHHIVERKGMKFVKFHEKIYQLEEGATAVAFDEEHHPTNAHKIILDFSLTKNAVTIFMVAILMLLVFFSAARFYKKGGVRAPRGIAGWVEPVVLFVNDVAKENIEGDKYKKFAPYLLTVFFFILFGNLLGLIPFLANPNMTGSISITLLLAMFTFIIQMVYSRKNFWGHIFAPPGVPVVLYPILIPIEIAGIFIKPAALMIRLFANITAGHIIVVSLISIIFVNQSAAWAGLSVPMTLFISTLEILVAFLQAYIFTMLSALFIGMAVETSHH